MQILTSCEEAFMRVSFDTELAHQNPDFNTAAVCGNYVYIDGGDFSYSAGSTINFDYGMGYSRNDCVNKKGLSG